MTARVEDSIPRLVPTRYQINGRVRKKTIIVPKKNNANRWMDSHCQFEIVVGLLIQSGAIISFVDQATFFQDTFQNAPIAFKVLQQILHFMIS